MERKHFWLPLIKIYNMKDELIKHYMDRVDTVQDLQVVVNEFINDLAAGEFNDLDQAQEVAKLIRDK